MLPIFGTDTPPGEIRGRRAVLFLAVAPTQSPKLSAKIRFLELDSLRLAARLPELDELALHEGAPILLEELANCGDRILVPLCLRFVLRNPYLFHPYHLRYLYLNHSTNTITSTGPTTRSKWYPLSSHAIRYTSYGILISLVLLDQN